MRYLIDHDLHIHSMLSSCSSDPAQSTEAILAYAKENGLKRLCLTDHFWDEEVEGASAWYAPQNFSHISRALPLPQDPQVRFAFGCETEMNKQGTIGVSQERIAAFDFIIVPTTHMHMKGYTIDESCVDAKGRAELWIKRFEILLDAPLHFEKVGIAHLTCGLMQNNSNTTSYEILDAIDRDRMHACFERAARQGLKIELNMGLGDTRSESALAIYRMAKECGCKFYLGSDAHHPSELKGAMKRFDAMIDALNLTEDDKAVIPF